MTHTIKDILREEIKFITHPDTDGIMGSCGEPCFQCEKDTKLTDWLKAHDQKLLQAVIDIAREVEKEKLPKVNEHGSRTFFVGGGAQMRMDAFNQGLQTALDIISKYKNN